MCIFEKKLFWDVLKYIRMKCKTLEILSKYIRIGTQLFDVYHMSFAMLFALKISSSFFGPKWFKTSLAIDY
jgi:hypothetical protein